MKALRIFFAVAAAISMATSLGYLNSIANNPTPEVNYLIPGLLVLSFIYLHLAISDYLVPIRSMKETEVDILKSATHKTYNNSFLRGVQGLGYILLISGIFPLFEPAIFENGG